MTLADSIAAAIIEHGPMAECHLATSVRKRKEDVSAELEGNPGRFVHNGLKARASRWDLARSMPSFDTSSLVALHPSWTLEWADEVVGWLVDAGFAASVNGNGTVHVSELGRRVSEAWIEAVEQS